MIIINLTGGLGNQMFQYALGRHLAIKHKASFKYHFTNALFNTPRRFELDVFNIKATKASSADLRRLGVFSNKIINRMLYLLDERFHIQFNKNIITERHPYVFDKDILSLPDNVYLQGFWQNENYFRDIAETIKKDFIPKHRLDEKNLGILKIIKNSTSVSIHVRRGDYISNKRNWKSGVICTTDYYRRAIGVINSRITDPVYFVFSDDPLWCKENIKTNKKTIYVDWNLGNNAYKDMILMSKCKHNIIANSSFSWWGAWLNDNLEKIVVAPKQWVYGFNASPSLGGWVKI